MWSMDCWHAFWMFCALVIRNACRWNWDDVLSCIVNILRYIYLLTQSTTQSVTTIRIENKRIGIQISIEFVHVKIDPESKLAFTWSESDACASATTNWSQKLSEAEALTVLVLHTRMININGNCVTKNMFTANCTQTVVKMAPAKSTAYVPNHIRNTRKVKRKNKEVEKGKLRHHRHKPYIYIEYMQGTNRSWWLWKKYEQAATLSAVSARSHTQNICILYILCICICIVQAN